MTAELLSVGTELLLGGTLNTDAQFLSQELAKLGINVYYQTTVGDNRARLTEALRIAQSRADLIITSGGLGPTGDDLTKEVCADFFQTPLVEDPASMAAIKAFFERKGGGMTANNLKQAKVPEGCRVMPNNNGTAPGVILENGGKTLIMLPGPPNELQPMFKESAEPFLRGKTSGVLVSRSLMMAGIGESAMEAQLSDIMDAYENPTVAPYVKPGGTMARITAKAADEEEARRLIAPVAAEIYKRLGQYIYGEDEARVEDALVKLLTAKNQTIATAESCTGGMVASMITNVPGASQVFKGGAVTYANEAKTAVLGVSEKTLQTHGAVSRETAMEMAEGAAKVFKADIGLSTTGIAGPTGGTKDKPIGLVYVGVHAQGRTAAIELRLSGNREKIRHRAAANALFELWRVTKTE